MKVCKRHPSEPGPGVCPLCLHERLLAVLTAQSGISSPSQDPPRWSDFYTTGSEALHPPPSLSADANHRFFRTPQENPRFSRLEAKKPSIISFLFGGPRSKETWANRSKPAATCRFAWFGFLFQGRRRNKKKKKNKAVDGAPMSDLQQGDARLGHRVSDQGMSPAEGEEVDTATESGYSTETSSGWSFAMPTPVRATPSSHHNLPQQHHHRPRRRVPMGLSMCMTPLVSTTAMNNRRFQAAESGFSGDLRSGPRKSSDSFGPARSRKLADFRKFR